MRWGPTQSLLFVEGVAGSNHSHLLSGFGPVVEEGTRVQNLSLLMQWLKGPPLKETVPL